MSAADDSGATSRPSHEPVQASWSLQALRRGLDTETALWMQRRYRALCGLVGLVMLVI